MAADIILPDDERAAIKKTITVWEARGGQCFREEGEAIARSAGCTHNPCAHCGTPTAKPWTACTTCRDRTAAERWSKFPAEPWAGESVYSDLTDEYYWQPTIEELRDVAIQHACASLDGLRLHFLEPQYPRYIDADSLWEDMLPEDQCVADISPKLAEAIEAVNEAIRTHGPVLSYRPAKRRAKFSQPNAFPLSTKGGEDG